MVPVRVARAFGLLIIAVTTLLALSGCISTSGPVAVAQPQSDLDSMAYGQTYYSAQPAAVSDSGGAISALRDGFAAGPRGAYASPPMAYAAAPRPVSYDAA